MNRKLIKLLPIQQWYTNNGVRVYFVERHELPIIEMSIIYNAGSCRDGERHGISQLTNMMLNQKTKHYSLEEITTGMEDIGAQLSLNSDRDSAIVSFRSLAKSNCLGKALKIFTDVATMPVFPEDRFLHLQKMTLSAIIRQTEMPEIIARNSFYSCLYGEHPYGHSVLGDPLSVSELTVKDLKHFYSQYYVAKNAKITIVGDLTRAKAEAIANQVAYPLKEGKLANKTPKAFIHKPVANEKILWPSQQAYVLIGQIGVSYDHKHYFPLLIGNQILGGSPSTSRLFKKIRQEHGLTYNIASSIVPLHANGPFVIMLQSRNQEIQKSIRITLETVDDFIKKGPTKNELIAVKKKIVNGFPLNIASNQDIANHLQRIAFYDLPLTFLEKYTEEIEAVTIKNIKDAFQESFTLNELAKVMVGPFIKHHV